MNKTEQNNMVRTLFDDPPQFMFLQAECVGVQAHFFEQLVQEEVVWEPTWNAHFAKEPHQVVGTLGAPCSTAVIDRVTFQHLLDHVFIALLSKGRGVF